MNKDSTLIGAIDQGTSSTRFLVFSAKDFQVNLKIPNSNKLSVLFFFLFLKQLITYHQVHIKLISDQAGYLYF